MSQYTLTLRRGADSPAFERARMYALDVGLVTVEELEAYYKVFGVIERLHERRAAFRALQSAPLQDDTYTAHWNAMQRALAELDGPGKPFCYLA